MSLVTGTDMAPSADAIKRAATRKRKAEAEARKGVEIRAEAEARPGTEAEAERGVKAEAAKKTKGLVKRVKVKKAEKEAENEGARKKGAVVKEVRKERPEGSKKRPRSPSPIDLTSDTPPKGTVGEMQSSLQTKAQPTLLAETQPSPGPTTGEPSTPAATPPPAGPGVELREESDRPEERAPTPPMVEGETSSQSLPFRTVLENRGKWAERLMSEVCTPELRLGLLERGSAAFFRDAFVAHLWTVNSLAVLKEILSNAELSLDHSNGEVETARARAAEIEKELDEARAARDEERNRADKESSRAEKAEAEEQVQRERAERAERALEEAQLTADRERKNAEEAEERCKRMEAEAFSYQSQLHAATIQLRGFEERVENAEEIARDADSRLAAMKETVEAAQEQIEAADKRATEAVSTFRQSSAYEEELADSTAFAFDLGFQECKAKVKRVLGLAEVDSIEPDDFEDQPSDSPPTSPARAP